MMTAILVFAVVAISAGCGGSSAGGGGSTGKDVVVNMKNTVFEKRKLEIKAGTTVRWINQDVIDHSVWEGVADSGKHLFQSADFGKGGDFAYTFEQPGTYKIFCSTAAHHLIGMNMEVVVK